MQGGQLDGALLDGALWPAPVHDVVIPSMN